MKKSNVSFENLLNQLSEEKINLVVDRNAIRAGWDILPPPPSPASSTGGSGSGSKSGSNSSKSGSTADNCGTFGICI
jgi:hypothetical protein